MRRRVTLLLGLPILLALTAACAENGNRTTTVGDPSERWGSFHRRAAEVAEAWQPGPAWKTGYVPLEAPTVLTGDPKFSDETKLAFQAGWYREQVAIPPTRVGGGVVRFPDGTLDVPLVSAAEAYRQLDLGDPPPCEGRPKVPGPTVEPGPDGPVATTPATAACTPLTVTGVKLGTVELRTSRGEATVPAWLFTVEELAVPVAQVAVAPSAVSAVPDAGPSWQPAPEVAAAQNVVSIEGAELTWRVGVGACDTGVQPLVAEFDDVVVVGAGVVRGTGVCTDQLKLEPVSATLKTPLGARTVLDVVTGSPVSMLGG
ncbi:hypothetical protein [Micromonospora sagamiensis]|uniref:Lipoprotein n=1 Tax=Micromonospora sagamiensis TaxID=47875 RepID=A0A562WM47_9ACTN|nr:hypothetical protein [Micromonospora sagamiensis]TWJ31121.1 hypothetical protein JD81_04674 [Micromonospora sagamiensis]